MKVRGSVITSERAAFVSEARESRYAVSRHTYIIIFARTRYAPVSRD